MDNNIYTGAIVAVAALIQQFLKSRDDARKQAAADARAAVLAAKVESDLHNTTATVVNAVVASTAASKTEVLGEIQKNTDISVAAFDAGNNFNSKLKAMGEALTDPALIMAQMAPANPDHEKLVLCDMQRKADQLEAYAHKWKHDLSNRLAVLEAEAQLRAHGVQ